VQSGREEAQGKFGGGERRGGKQLGNISDRCRYQTRSGRRPRVTWTGRRVANDEVGLVV
jgi:hypothetical protein